MIDLLFSLFVYTFLALFVFAKGKNACIYYCHLHDRQNADRMLISAALFFVFISGIRYEVGMDCESYAEAYEYLVNGMDISFDTFHENLEIGFIVISKLFAALHLPRFAYMGFWAFCEFFFFFKALRKRIYLVPYAGLILILGPFYISWMNGIRQTVAACIFTFALADLIDSNSWIKYVILVLAASFIHTSALLLIPLCLLKFYNFQPNKYVCLALLFFSYIIGHLFNFAEFFRFSDIFLDSLGYESYSENLDYYIDAESTITNYGPRRIVLFLSHVLVILFSDNLFHKHQNDRFLRVSYLLFLVYSLISELAVAGNLLFMRPFLYCLPFVIICQAYTLAYLFGNFKYFYITHRRVLKLTKPISIVVLIFTLICFCSYIYLDNIASVDVSDAAVIYKTYFGK